MYVCIKVEIFLISIVVKFLIISYYSYHDCINYIITQFLFILIILFIFGHVLEKNCHNNKKCCFWVVKTYNSKLDTI